MQKIRFIIFGLFLMNSMLLFSQEREYMIKSAVLEKMTRFIKWPDNKLEEKTIVNLGIFTGENEVFNTFSDFFSDQNIRGRPVIVDSITSPEMIPFFDIIYVCGSYTGDLTDIMNAISLNQGSCLLVCETIGYGEMGAHINFIIKENKLRYEINLEQMNKSGFYVWAQLLNSADIITTGRK